MLNMTAPWFSRPAFIGAGVGVAAGLAARAAAGADPAPGALVGAALLLGPMAAGYFAGCATEGGRRLASAASHVQRLRASLRASQDHLMENGSSRSLAAWLAGISRSIRDDAAALSGDARSLQADSTLPESARTAAARIGERAASLAKACAPLGGYALREPSRSPFDVNTLVREALDLLRARAEEKKIRFDEHFAVLPPVFGPAARVHAALLNVLVNAVEAMPFGGGVIHIATAHEGDRVVARIRDTGIGIRPEHLGRVTEPFFTTKPEKTSAGLGLWEARDAVEAIGGTIALHSVPHQGTEVVLTFPQAAPLSPGRVGVPHPEEVARNTADEGDRRIA